MFLTTLQLNNLRFLVNSIFFSLGIKHMFNLLYSCALNNVIESFTLNVIINSLVSISCRILRCWLNMFEKISVCYFESTLSFN